MVCLQLEIGAVVCFRLAPHDVNFAVTLQGAVPAEPQRRRLAVGRGQEVRRAHRALDRSQLQVSCTPLTPSHGWACWCIADMRGRISSAVQYAALGSSI